MVLDHREWLEADGLGGFASGTVSGTRTRRYQALLLSATTPPTGRMVLVNGFDAWVTTPMGTYPLSSQHYAPDVVHPDGASHLISFTVEPWPQWVFQFDEELTVIQELFVVHGSPLVALSWRLKRPKSGVTLEARPFLSGRDYHALHHENPVASREAAIHGERIGWKPYAHVPGVSAISNGRYEHQPDWYRNFLYEEERARGLNHTEDLLSPGSFHWSLSEREALLLFSAEGSSAMPAHLSAQQLMERSRAVERKRRKPFTQPLAQSADAYFAKRGEGTTLIAGFPWFTDWGRDTFISLRGLCLATGRLEEARHILMEWAGAVSEGMLPNRFPDRNEKPEFNSVDASLWYVIAVDAYLKTLEAEKQAVPKRDQAVFRQAIEAILQGYAQGTRYNIHADTDGLLACGEPGVQLTWMDAKVGDWVVTPRIGKPVEVQALWLNALWIGSAFSERWEELFARGREAYRAKFWNEQMGFLYDVIDVDHQPGKFDPSCRPNQIFAVGGLPLKLINGDRGRRIVEVAESRLLTPAGLRSLAPGEAGYIPRYTGGVRERDGAYHQGTVWPWLMGPFVEAWIRVHGSSVDTIREARQRFVEPLKQFLQVYGLGHLPEIADAEAPHTPRGCPFQAWSLAELLRLEPMLQALETATANPVALRKSAGQKALAPI